MPPTNFPTMHLLNVLGDEFPDKLPLLTGPWIEKINLGSGGVVHGIDEGFVNVDRSYNDGWLAGSDVGEACIVAGDVLSDLFDLFEPGCASVVYSHHVIEHIPHRLVRETIKQWASLLRPGGIMYLGGPDAIKVADLVRDRPDLWDEANSFLISGGAHRAAIWEQALIGMMYDAGFSEVKAWGRDRSEFKSHMARVEFCVVGVKS